MKAIFKSDKLRIEDALLPALMLCILEKQRQLLDTEEHPFINVYPVLSAFVNLNINSAKLEKRLRRLVLVCLDYTEKSNFEPNKSFTVVTMLGTILCNKSAIDVEKGSPLQKLWHEFYLTIKRDGRKSINGYKLFLASSLKQVPKLLKVIQQQGYYI